MHEEPRVLCIDVDALSLEEHLCAVGTCVFTTVTLAVGSVYCVGGAGDLSLLSAIACEGLTKPHPCPPFPVPSCPREAQTQGGGVLGGSDEELGSWPCSRCHSTAPPQTSRVVGPWWCGLQTLGRCQVWDRGPVSEALAGCSGRWRWLAAIPSPSESSCQAVPELQRPIPSRPSDLMPVPLALGGAG